MAAKCALATFTPSWFSLAVLGIRQRYPYLGGHSYRYLGDYLNRYGRTILLVILLSGSFDDVLSRWVDKYAIALLESL
jgi:hypothetical protein